MEHPAVFPIYPADASFVFEDFSSREAVSPHGHNPLNVPRVNESSPIPAGHFVQSDAQVFQPRFIEVIEVAVGPSGVYQRRDRVDEKLNIQRLGLLFGRGHRGMIHPEKSTRGNDRVFHTEGADQAYSTDETLGSSANQAFSTRASSEQSSLSMRPRRITVS